jgi:hypothetical protein
MHKHHHLAGDADEVRDREMRRCNAGEKYVCKDGPVFSLAELDKLTKEWLIMRSQSLKIGAVF